MIRLKPGDRVVCIHFEYPAGVQGPRPNRIYMVKSSALFQYGTERTRIEKCVGVWSRRRFKNANLMDHFDSDVDYS